MNHLEANLVLRIAFDDLPRPLKNRCFSGTLGGKVFLIQPRRPKAKLRQPCKHPSPYDVKHGLYLRPGHCRRGGIQGGQVVKHSEMVPKRAG